MRIIDADALPNELFKKHVHDGEELEPMLYFEDAVKVVENAPTIDAIPVEWLEGQADYARSEWDYDTCEGIRIVLKTWQKEQEENGE